MNNTVKTNREVKTNKGENVMKNTKNTKSAKNSKTVIAAVSALVTATTMAAGLAVMAAFAPANNTASTKPVPAVTTVSQAPKAENAQAAQAAQNVQKPAVKAETKDVKAVNNKMNANEITPVQQQTAPAAAQQAAPVVTQQAAPVVTQQAAPVVTQQAAPAAVAQQPEAVNELGKHPGECGYNYVNENGKHPGECGYNYTAPEEKAAPAAQQPKLCTVPEGQLNDWTIHNAKDGFPVGCYFGKTNAKSTLNVVMVNSYTYSITVSISTGDNTADVYNITAIANGSKMEYSNASKSSVVYDANGNAAQTQLVDNNHKGTFDASDVGYTWVDNGTATVFVPWIGY